MKIIITGASGFIGKHVIKYFNALFQFNKYNRKKKFKIRDEQIVIHLAGKAHDLQNVAKPQEYYIANTLLTKDVFDEFLKSNAKIFIMMSTIKAVSDSPKDIVTEENIANPKTHYGKSKFKAEKYILSKSFSSNKKVYILRPCMVHGEGNKGNFNLLYKLIKNRVPWPLGAFNNKRSYCSIENLLFIIKELLNNSKIPSGVYNIADDVPLSTNEIIKLIGIATNLKPKIFLIPKILIKIFAKVGDFIYFPLNTERLKKITESFIVSNFKIKNAINKPFPVSSKDGLIKTFKSFS